MARRRPATFTGIAANPFQAVSADYAHNLLVGTSLCSLDPQALPRLENSGLVLSMAEAGAGVPAGTPFSRAGMHAALRLYVDQAPVSLRRPSPLGEPTRTNLGMVAARVGLDEVERDALQFLVCVADQPPLREVVRALGNVGKAEGTRIIASAIGRYPREVRTALAPTGRLISSGLLDASPGWNDVSHGYEVMAGLADMIGEDGLDADALLRRFLPGAKPTDLGWGDFVHIEREVRLAGELLREAVRQRSPGVNILFHGETGTGKTSLASLLAREAGASLHQAGNADSSGDSPSTRDRVSSLRLGQKLLGGGGDAVLLFDELDDLFQPSTLFVRGRDLGPARSLSKQWFNLLLETNPVPVIWTTNSVDGMDPAALRRFSYAIEFSKCGARQRARVLERHLTSPHRLSTADISAVAAHFEASPARVASALAASRLLCGDAGPDRPTLEAVLAPIDRLVNGSMRSGPHFEPERWSPHGVNCSTDPVVLADRLVTSLEISGPTATRQDGQGLSLCLYGRPGTGKSEYVRYLAWRLGRPVVVKRVSDILSKWVGEAERQIAAAFREAENDGAVLLFDEADTFLRSRSSASQSWEVSQVNEFLQQLEASKGLVACTTNLWRELDEAALRRFTFKIEFGWLEGRQGLAVFRSVLGPLLDRPLGMDAERLEVELARLNQLAPGDFAVVARRVRATTGTAGVWELLADLREEVRVKGGSAARAGF